MTAPVQTANAGPRFDLASAGGKKLDVLHHIARTAACHMQVVADRGAAARLHETLPLLPHLAQVLRVAAQKRLHLGRGIDQRALLIPLQIADPRHLCRKRMFRRADLCLMHRVLHGGPVHDHHQHPHHLPPVGQRLIDRRPLGAVQHGAREIEMPCDLPPGQGLFKVVRNLVQQVRWDDLRQVFAHDLIRWPAEGRAIGVIDESIGHIGREKGRLHRQMVEEVGQSAPCLIGVGGVLQLAPVAHHAPDLRHQHRKRRHRKDQFDRIAIGAAARGRCRHHGDIKRQDRNRAPHGEAVDRIADLLGDHHAGQDDPAQRNQCKRRDQAHAHLYFPSKGLSFWPPCLLGETLTKSD